MADWAGLDHDLIVSILEKTNVVEDFAAFVLVCKSWNEAFSNNKEYLRRCTQSQSPWLILPEKENKRQIYSLSKDEILRNSLYMPELSDKKCIGLNYGWVLTISRRGGGKMNLVHPLTRTVFELPSQTSVEDYEKYRTRIATIFTRRAALSANPLESPDFVLMIVHCSAGYYLAYWRSGDKRWNRIELERRGCFADLTFYQDQFYAIKYDGSVFGCKVSGRGHPIVARLLYKIDCNLVDVNWEYIVGSGGTLLAVIREDDEDEEEEEEIEISRPYRGESDYDDDDERLGPAPTYWLDSLDVYELDLNTGGWKKIKRLGDRAIFIGNNTSLALDNVSQFGGRIKSNCIYFTDDLYERFAGTKKGGGKAMGSYNLEDAKTTKFDIKVRDQDELLSRVTPPFWFMPSL